MSENIVKRCALVYYSNFQGKISILLGICEGELTTIGGRKKKSKKNKLIISNESNLDCCCREVFEETRELVNFYHYKHGLNSGSIYTYCSCSYYLLEEEHSNLVALTEQFKITNPKNEEQNELSELVLFDLDKLTEMLILNTICYRDRLKDFVLNVLFRLLKPFKNKGIPVINISLKVDLNIPLSQLPMIVDWISEEEYNNLITKPIIFGKTIGGFITECFYEGCNLYISQKT